MSEFTQANRPMAVYTTLGEDVLVLDAFHGVESISMPFTFQLDMLSLDPDIDAADILRQPVVVRVDLADGTPRYIHGLVSRFAQLGQRDNLTFYRAEVVPWLWFLSLSRDCRIFQNMTVPEIIEQVFKDQGYSDFDIRCTETFKPREYCVQYRETNLNFVSRLMEEEGIFYFFEHSDSKHLLVLADNNGSTAACAGAETVRYTETAEPDEDVVRSLLDERAVHPGTVTLTTYDYLQPSLNLESSLKGEDGEEIYDYPGKYTTPDQGERYARLQLEAEEARREVVRGEGTCRGLESGYTFTLTDHYRSKSNIKYLLTRVQHFAKGGGYRAWESGEGLEYRNDFLAIPFATPYRPPRRTPKPVVHGSQTALVVGKPGEEVWVDKHCRIKVHFYWNRQDSKDDGSSCWIRVATPWGGKGWGGVTIPRIGNEVVVAFEEGDPDRPLVIGSVYNAEQTPPFGLPDSGIQMGMKSRSSPGGGGYNEITMTDTKGSEQMTIHAQYNMDTTVENDQTLTVHNNRKGTIDVNDDLDVGAKQTIHVVGNRDTTVDSDDSLTVSGSRSHTITGDESIEITGSQSTKVTGTRGAKITGDDTVEGSVNIGRKAGVNISLDAGVQFAAKGGAMAQIESPMITVKGSVVQVGDGVITIKGSAITLSAGGSSIAITPGGITMSGPLITSAASGMNKVSGGVVMIN